MELKGDISSRKNDNPGDVAPEFRPLTLEEWLPLGPVGRKAAAELVNDSETQVVIVASGKLEIAYFLLNLS